MTRIIAGLYIRFAIVYFEGNYKYVWPNISIRTIKVSQENISLSKLMYVYVCLLYVNKGPYNV